MKRYLLGMLVLASFGTMTSCSKDDKDTNTPVTPPTDSTSDVIVLSGDISKDSTLKADKKYLLKGFVYVTKGATLTIEPGTVIRGDKATTATLVITRGSKINAAGTKEKPIIFTSNQPVGAREHGDWGGVILLGKATVNPTDKEAKIEGGLTPTAGGAEKDYIWYGGTNDDDNSGVMTYVRIEFGGVAFTPDNEINGLTLGGVGRGTKLSYIQVYRSGDDAFEWFGGTVNADHLVATLTLDDDFDTDNGYRGHVQFGVAQRYKTLADQSGSNGFESDNDAAGSTNAPKTQAIFSNMTIIGPIQSGSAFSGINANFQHGAQIRRNSAMNLRNSIIVGFQYGVYIDDSKGSKTSLNAKDGSLVFANNVIAGCTFATKSEWTGTEFNDWWTATKTDTVTNAQDLGLVDAYKFSAAVATAVGTPSFLLKTTSKAYSGAVFAGLSEDFTVTTYRGAFDDKNDWTLGWTTNSAEKTEY